MSLNQAADKLAVTPYPNQMSHGHCQKVGNSGRGGYRLRRGAVPSAADSPDGEEEPS